MKIAKVLMFALAVSLCCATANAQNDCATAIPIACGSSALLDLALDDTPTAVSVGPYCGLSACAPFDFFCQSDQDCIDSGSADPRCVFGSTDVYASFVATETTVRIRTDAGGSAGTDSTFSVYSVDQTNTCDQVGWNSVGCSLDEGVGYNGDISIEDLMVGDTYIIQLGSWLDQANGVYELTIVCPADGLVCGDDFVNPFGGEECDGADNAACEVSCEADCTCTPDVCGNDIRHGDEECDGTDKDACILECDTDGSVTGNPCTCEPVPTPMLPKWGLVGLALMLILGGAAVFGRGRMGVQQV